MAEAILAVLSYTKGMNLDEAATAILNTGVMMLKDGSEVFRVEDTMNRMGRTFPGITNCTAYVTLTGVMVSISTKDQSLTKIARVHSIGHNLERIAALNQLSRDCAAEHESPDQIMARLSAISREPVWGSKIQIVGGALGALGFGIFFGCNFIECVLIFCAALLVQALGWWLDKYGANSYLEVLLQTLLASYILVTLNRLLFGLHMDAMLLSVLMLLVPGMTLTSAIRDILTGNYVSGNARLAQALLIGIFIALGAAIVLYGAIA